MLTAIFLCTIASAGQIVDGDTAHCLELAPTGKPIAVRLVGVDAPELHGCKGRRGRVCVKGDAQAAKRNLERLAVGRVLRCEATGTSYNRVTAFCSADGRDLSCAQIRAGFAAYVPSYDKARRLVGCEPRRK